MVVTIVARRTSLRLAHLALGTLHASPRLLISKNIHYNNKLRRWCIPAAQV